MEEWNKLCSLKLMGLIIQEEERKLIEIREEIQTVTSSVTEYVATSEYKSLQKKSQESLEKLEQQVMAMKKSKFTRDVSDYQNNQIYVWRKRYNNSTPRSILKQNQSWNHSDSRNSPRQE